MHTEDNTFKQLSSRATLKVGELHWKMLRSPKLMDTRRWREVKEEGKSFSRHEWTSFGNEVGLDEIHWWIFKREKDVAELGKHADTALRHAERLKRSSERLRRNRPQSYEDLITSLRKFADNHLADIEGLLAFVDWLQERDPMAPRILFTYRVWGSTRMSDRTIKVPEEIHEADNAVRLQCSQIVLGLTMDAGPVYDSVAAEMLYEIFEGMDGQELASGRTPHLSDYRVIARAANEVYSECAAYFREVRDSLRNILVDVDKFQGQEAVLYSDEF